MKGLLPIAVAAACAAAFLGAYAIAAAGGEQVGQPSRGTVKAMRGLTPDTAPRLASRSSVPAMRRVTRRRPADVPRRSAPARRAPSPEPPSASPPAAAPAPTPVQEPRRPAPARPAPPRDPNEGETFYDAR